MSDRTVVVIPARYSSSRLPGKPLISIAGKPLILWVYHRALQIAEAETVLVATDDERISRVVKNAGGQVQFTPANLRSGTERVAYVARKLAADIIVNVQGDEPLFPVAAVAEAISEMRKNPHIPVATLAAPLTEKADWENPSVVKVLLDRAGRALLFSRSPLPHFRDSEFKPLNNLMRHIGIYLFRKPFLQDYVNWEISPLESAEKLEQLRILENGYPIRVIRTPHLSRGVDTPEDIPIVERMLKGDT